MAETQAVTAKTGALYDLGAACFAALRKLVEGGTIGRDERVVIFNTGSGIKYLECYEPGT